MLAATDLDHNPSNNMLCKPAQPLSAYLVSQKREVAGACATKGRGGT
jgi:hypothetical protein